MSYEEWLAVVSGKLDEAAEWTEGDLSKYYYDGFSPDEAVAELQMRELARA